MGGAWGLLTVCQALNLNLSPMWWLKLLCPCQPGGTGRGGGLHEERLVSCPPDWAFQFQLSARAQPRSLPGATGV